MRKRVETELPSLPQPAMDHPAESRRTGSAAKRHPDQARQRYALSVEEIRAWERQVERHGLYGLRATRVQIYRRDETS
jgi:hypothetical protein